MKNIFRSLLGALLLLLITAPVTFSQKSEYVKQVIISNGGLFESTPPYVDYVTEESYNPDTKVSTFFNTIYTQSTQDVIIEGNIAYVAAQDSIVMYNLDTYERVAAIADSGISRLGFCNGSLVVTKQYPITRFFVEVLNGNSLALLARIQSVSGECGGAIQAGDTLYVAVNYGYAGTSGNLAVINPVNWKLVREVALGTTAKGISDLYLEANHIWGVCRTPFGSTPEGGIVRYNYQSGSFLTTVIPYLISNGIGINGNLVYMVMNYAIGTFNLNTLLVETPILFPDPGSLGHVYYTSEAIDYVNNYMYANIGNYSSFSIGYIGTLAGDSVGSYTTGINSEAMAIDFRTVQGVPEAQDNGFEFSIFPNPVNDRATVTFPANAGVSEIRVSDLTGRIMKTVPVQADAARSAIDLTGLSGGVYLLTVTSEKGIQTKKIIKN
ncbi:MAG TPA: T9SS type A sorting domain-containing protein [Bacteroidales bacterium]|nr:T9SS type A sorting domain-containing protein [Bacteroidales bacterium]